MNNSKSQILLQCISIWCVHKHLFLCETFSRETFYLSNVESLEYFTCSSDKPHPFSNKEATLNFFLQKGFQLVKYRYDLIYFWIYPPSAQLYVGKLCITSNDELSWSCFNEFLSRLCTQWNDFTSWRHRRQKLRMKPGSRTSTAKWSPTPWNVWKIPPTHLTRAPAGISLNR